MAKKGHYAKILSNFKNMYPEYRLQVADYRPHDYVSIAIELQDGTRFIYNDDTKKLR